MRGRLQFALLGVGLLSSAKAWAAEPSSFTLETGSPDALCPALEVTRELVARRLGSLVVEGRKGWRARYTIGHAPSKTPQDFIRLELFNPDGRVELLRDLPIEGDSCRTMAEVIALVLDRYFRGLGADDPRPTDATHVPVVQQRPKQPPVAPLQPPAQGTLMRRVALEYAVSSAFAQSWVGSHAAAALGTDLELGLGARVGLTPQRESARRGASVEARAAAVRSSLAWRFAIPAGLLLHLGPSVSLGIEQATTRGLANPSDRLRVLWSTGLQAAFVAPLGPSLFVQSAISADVLVTSGHFFIEEREVLVPRWLTLSSSFSLGYSWGK